MVYLMDIVHNFSISPTLLKGLHKYSLKIIELFWEVKMEMGFLEKYKINRDTKRSHILHHNCKIFFMKTSPVHNSKSKLCTRLFKFKNYSKIGWEICMTVLWCNQMRALVEKVDMLSWNKSPASEDEQRGKHK